jgi:hypothetical protein
MWWCWRSAVTSGSIDLAAGTDRLTLGNFANTLTISNVETITGGISADHCDAGDSVQRDGGSGLVRATRLTLGDFANTVTVLNIQTVTGGTSDDVIVVGGTSAAVVVDLGAGTDTLTFGSNGGTVTASNIETITGGTSRRCAGLWAVR